MRGPSITPRPPQGQPVVTVLGHGTVPYRLAARQADVLFVTPSDTGVARETLAEARQLAAEAGREGGLQVFADLLVFLGSGAEARKEELDGLAGAELFSDARIVARDAVNLRPGNGPASLYGNDAVTVFNQYVDALELQDYSSDGTPADVPAWINAGVSPGLLSEVADPIPKARQSTKRTPSFSAVSKRMSAPSKPMPG